MFMRNFGPKAVLVCGPVWVVRLSEKQLEVLRAVIRSERHRGPALEGALEALDLARYDDLPEAQLPWLEVSHEAERQGVSEADVIWDMSGRLPEKACEPIDLSARLHEVLDDDYDDDGEFEADERWAA